MSMINVINLGFAYEGSYDDIFENVSFQIDSNWKLGLIGRNGRGKTTFLNLLLGKYAYSGIISTDVQFEYFPYEVEDKSQDTLEVLHKICPGCEDWEIMKELSQLSVEADVLYRSYETLSNGEQTKVLLAALFLGGEKFLLIDEPTNHLDAEARSVVGNYLKRKKGFILVSHDRELLDTCIDHILSINKADIEVQKGDFSSWWENKQRQDQFELAENEKLRREVHRLSVAARRQEGWSGRVERSKYGSDSSGSKADRGYIGHKSAKMMKRAKNIEARREEAVRKKSELLHNIEEYGSLKLQPLCYHKDVLAEVRGLSVFYGDKKVCENVEFMIRRGDRISLSGKNGCGKSSILKIICGEDIAYTGELAVGSGLKISYVPQDTSHLCGRLSEYAGQYEIDESLFKAVLRKLGFERSQFDKDMGDFSAGQKKKVLIARSLCERAHLYIWDEPLNFIDVFSRIQIEELIMTYRPTLLFVEHDAVFRKNIASRASNIHFFQYNKSYE